MPPTFKKSNYVNNVREIIDMPSSKHNLINSKEYPELKHVVLLGAEQPGFLNWETDIFQSAQSSSLKEMHEIEATI
jgi:hypothetical protein